MRYQLLTVELFLVEQISRNSVSVSAVEVMELSVSAVFRFRPKLKNSFGLSLISQCLGIGAETNKVADVRFRQKKKFRFRFRFVYMNQ